MIKFQEIKSGMFDIPTGKVFSPNGMEILPKNTNSTPSVAPRKTQEFGMSEETFTSQIQELQKKKKKDGTLYELKDAERAIDLHQQIPKEKKDSAKQFAGKLYEGFVQPFKNVLDMKSNYKPAGIRPEVQAEVDKFISNLSPAAMEALGLSSKAIGGGVSVLRGETEGKREGESLYSAIERQPYYGDVVDKSTGVPLLGAALGFAGELAIPGLGGEGKAVGKLKPKVKPPSLTTSFLNYAEEKLAKNPNATFSKQEITDFARRPELKKGEADNLLKKLEEFGGEGQYLYHGTNEQIIDSIVKEGLKPMSRGLLSFSKDESYARSFAREGITPQGKTNAIMFRVKSDLLEGKTVSTNKPRPASDKLNEILTKETIPPQNIEIFKDGKWQSLTGQPSSLPAQEFADSIRRDLLELKPVKVKEPQYKQTTLQGRKLEEDWTKKPFGGKNYEEVVFESPIKTDGSSHFPNSKNYFAHARGDEVVESGKKIWREQEIQSDALQKDNFNRLNKENVMPPFDEKFKAREKEISKLSPFTNDRFGERIMRERIKAKAAKGYEKYRLPTGETIGKIEGFENAGRWSAFNEKNGLMYTPHSEDLKVGMQLAEGGETRWVITDILGEGRFKAVEKDFLSNSGVKSINDKNLTPDIKAFISRHQETFDLTGKSNPQYRRYENWGKFLKNKYGGKEVTDPQGNSWIEIDLNKEMGEQSVMAYGKTNIGTVMGVGAATVGALSIPFIAGSKESTVQGSDPTNLPVDQQQEGKFIIIRDRNIEVDSSDLDILRGVLFAEISNRNPNKRDLEARVVANTALNRMRETGKSLKEVLTQKGAYQGLTNKQFKKYRDRDLNVLDEGKLSAVDIIIQEIQSGDFEDNTEGSVFYIHKPDGSIQYRSGKLGGFKEEYESF